MARCSLLASSIHRNWCVAACSASTAHGGDGDLGQPDEPGCAGLRDHRRWLRHRRRERIEAPQRNRLARHLAIAVFAVLDPADGGIDLGHQLALPVPRAQFQRPVGLLTGAVGDVGDVAGAVLETFEGCLPEAACRLLGLRLPRARFGILLEAAEVEVLEAGFLGIY